jgi:hypothetical protein
MEKHAFILTYLIILFPSTTDYIASNGQRNINNQMDGCGSNQAWSLLANCHII